MTNHQKHTNLKRRKSGNFAPTEIAILGTACSRISQWVDKISERISQSNIAYFDASHAEDLGTNKVSNFTFHPKGNLNVSTQTPVNKYVQRIQFSQFDCVFINGNHYPGSRQIIFLDAAKEASINKRIDQISDIQFFIKLTEPIEPFQSIKDKFENWKEIPQYGIHDLEEILDHVSSLLSKSIPGVKGLVLTGGKSTRMGKDKATLDYFGKPHKEFIKEMLERLNLQTYYAVRNHSVAPNEIQDVFLNLGPFGGICSAFQKDPNTAWMVLATDLPFVNQKLLTSLLTKRNPSKVATAVKGKGKEFPEPLIAIYEPKAYPMLLQFLAQGYSCPRKMLINSDVEMVEVEDDLIQNINTPEEFKAAKRVLSKS